MESVGTDGRVLCVQDNPELALVQARWSFVNKDENLLTRLQNINLSFHFEVEQQVNGVFLNYFGFNGTAGVWRIKALEESGGWLDRTTVEDMDIAVRAHLQGWKFIFLNDVRVSVLGVFWEQSMVGVRERWKGPRAFCLAEGFGHTFRLVHSPGVVILYNLRFGVRVECVLRYVVNVCREQSVGLLTALLWLILIGEGLAVF